jgi:NAD-dependent deacetylase
MSRKKLVVLSGAGVSAESGIPTFRDANGLWEGHDINEVATPEGFQRNPELVLEFYNQRRKNALSVHPNEAHQIIAELENHFDVHVITQNVDNLHENAGSTKVVHLHGELFKVRSTLDDTLVYDLVGWELKMGDTCEKGSQLRPHIVWFGEMVPMMETAARIVSQADIFVVVGTSLQVYPAAGLVDYCPLACPKYIIDPFTPDISHIKGITVIQEKASIGMKLFKEMILQTN